MRWRVVVARAVISTDDDFDSGCGRGLTHELAAQVDSRDGALLPYAPRIWPTFLAEENAASTWRLPGGAASPPSASFRNSAARAMSAAMSSGMFRRQHAIQRLTYKHVLLPFWCCPIATAIAAIASWSIGQAAMPARAPTPRRRSSPLCSALVVACCVPMPTSATQVLPARWLAP